jgi:hypothetical protein
MKKKIPSKQKQSREQHAAGWGFIAGGVLLLFVSNINLPFLSGFMLQSFGKTAAALFALMVVYGVIRLNLAGKRSRMKGHSVKEVAGLLVFSWVVGTVELLTVGNYREIEQYTSRYAGSIGSLLIRSLSVLVSIETSLFLSILILSFLIALIWRNPLVSLLRRSGQVVFHVTTLSAKENRNRMKKHVGGKNKTVGNRVNNCPICDTAGVAFIISGGILLVGVLINLYSTRSVLFFTFGYLMYGVPVYLGWVGFTFILAQVTGRRVLEVVRVMLSFPVLCWIVGSIELLIWYTGGKETLALTAGSIGLFPFIFFNNFTSGRRTFITALVFVLAAAAFVLLPQILRMFQQVFRRRVAEEVSNHYDIKPSVRQVVPAGEYVESKEKRIPADRDIPLPVSILPELPLAAGHVGDSVQNELVEIEEKLIDVIFRLTQIRLERAPGREPVMGISTMQLAFRPHEANRKAIKNLLNLNYDLALELKRSPVRITLKDVIMIEIPLDEEKRTFVYVKEILDSNEKIPEPTYLVGKTADGRQFELPVKKSLNVLIGGQVGAGKSVLLHSFIFGIIFRWKPSEVQFALYDHKVEEFKRYSRLPHLWHPVADSQSKFMILLEKLEQELERRKRVRERDEQASFSLLIVIMDEFRGLSSERLMTLIAECRSLNMAFVLATQYPRADVMSTPIKANLTTGISFRMRDATGSRLIIGESGGEMLLGNGDCLVSTSFCFEHAQAAYCRKEDLQAVSEYLRAL